MSAPLALHATVGRGDELEAIRALVGSIDETSRALFLEGPPGIGKTRLWLEGVACARSAEVRTLTSRATEADAQFAFAAVGDLLRESTEEVLDELPAPQRRALATALLLEEGHSLPPGQTAVAAAVLGALRALSRNAPVLVALDDLQWLDAPSFACLGYAFRRLGSARVALLATARTAHEVDVEDLIRSLPEELTGRLEVAPLTVAALYELVRERFDLALTRPTLVRLHEISGGNPFYALEIARLIASSEPLGSGSDLPVPAALSELLRTRLATLSPATRRVLLTAAALARPTRAALAEADGDADDAVREAVAAEVLDQAPDAIRFAHPLFASVLYAGSAAADRRAVHQRLSTTARDVEERARHLALASVKASSRVARALDDAAEHALSRGAVAAAADLAEQAARLTPPGSAAARVARIVAAAELRYAAGETARAIGLLEDALAHTPHGPDRAALLLCLGIVKFEAEDTRVGREICLRALEHAGNDDRLRARIHERLSFGAGGVIGLRRSEQHAERAVELAQRVGDTATHARALVRVANIRFNRGEGFASELFEEAVRLEEQVGGLELDYGPTAVYARALHEVGRTDDARLLLERLCERGRATGDAAVNWPLFLLADIELHTGRWEQAAALARESYDVAVQTGREGAEAKGLFTLAHVEILRGELAAGRARAERALVLTDGRGWNSGGPRGALALLELSLENYAAARDALVPVVERYRSLGSYLSGEFDVAEALAGLACVEEGRELLARSEAEAVATGIPWAVAAAARARGLLAAAADELDDAAAALEQARVAGERAGSPFELGRTLLALGAVERRLHRKQAARRTLGQALALFEKLGAPVWAERARRELARIGGRAAPAGAELSEMEARIAGLVGDGASNKEVAATLHLSPKTVEWNLSKIYRKVDVRSRSELAARLRKSGDLTG